MILLEGNDRARDDQARQIVALFGVGLIGFSVKSALCKIMPFNINDISFTWNAPHRQSNEAAILQNHIVASCGSDSSSSVSRIDIVWAAGRAGFGSSEAQLAAEMCAFNFVLSFSRELANRLENVRHSFHLISSAGGLFESQKHVDP